MYVDLDGGRPLRVPNELIGAFMGGGTKHPGATLRRSPGRARSASIYPSSCDLRQLSHILSQAAILRAALSMKGSYAPIRFLSL